MVGVKRQQIYVSRLWVESSAVYFKRAGAFGYIFQNRNVRFLARLIISGITVRKAYKLTMKWRKLINPSEIIFILPHKITLLFKKLFYN